MTTATIAPTITQLPPMSDDWWEELTEGAPDVATPDEADHLAPFDAAGLNIYERRALFAWLRYKPAENSPYHTLGFAKDPLLVEMKVSGWYSDHPEHEAGYLELTGEQLLEATDPDWWPGSIESEMTGPSRCLVWLMSLDGRWMATFIVFGPLHGHAVALMPAPALAGGGGDLANAVEAVRAEGGRRPGRPPSAGTALATMNPRKRMTVACELVENEGWRQADAARAAGVTPTALNRALARRRDVRRRD